MLFSLHHLATHKPLLLHSSTCFDHIPMLGSCLNVLIPSFIRNFPIILIVDDLIPPNAIAYNFYHTYFRMCLFIRQDEVWLVGYDFYKIKSTLFAGINTINSFAKENLFLCDLHCLYNRSHFKN